MTESGESPTLTSSVDSLVSDARPWRGGVPTLGRSQVRPLTTSGLFCLAVERRLTFQSVCIVKYRPSPAGSLIQLAFDAVTSPHKKVVLLSPVL